jgi:hypothetical protein
MNQPKCKAGSEASVDCDRGREMGCGTFCCRLLVRLDPEEREAVGCGQVAKGFVDKDPENGNCVHLDTQTNLCRIWARRPRVCREYSCNGDELLQVVLRHGFSSLGALLKIAREAYIPKETYVFVPHKNT